MKTSTLLVIVIVVVVIVILIARARACSRENSFSASPRSSTRSSKFPRRIAEVANHNSKHRVQSSNGKRNKACPVDISPKTIRQDVLNESNTSPNDPNAAIGLDRIISVVNGAVAIIDKSSNNTIQRYTDVDFWNFVPVNVTQSLVGDPVVLYDDFSQRFFTTIWANTGLFDDGRLTIDSPGSIAGEYPGSIGVAFPSPWNLSGYEIVAADPINADTPLVNGAATAGKLVLVASDNFNTGSFNKGSNVADAGGVGMILYNTEGNFLYSIFGGPLPSLSVGQDIGEDILANLPGVIGGIRSLTPQEVGVGGYSQQLLAVSKDSSPNSRDDFYFYEIGDSTGPWVELYGDYPKLGINGKALYLYTNDHKFPANIDGIRSKYDSITAVEKGPLLDGTGVNILYFNSQIRASDWFLPIPTYAHQPSISNENEVAFFVSPVIDSPIIDNTGNIVQNGYASGHSFKIYALRNVTTSPTLDGYVVEVEPFYNTWRTDIPNTWNLAKQPEGVFEGFELTLEVIGLPIVMYRAVLRKDQLYFCINVGDEKLEVRWYQVDVSKIYDANAPSVKLVQEGKISLENDVGAYYPSLDVDVNENMGIGFTISGLTQPVSLAHTGRCKDDPPGTLRSPFPVYLSAQPELPFYDGLYDFIEPNILASRWDDYTSVQVDPVDGKTFWYNAEYSNQNIDLYFEGLTERRTALATFSIDGDNCETKSRPSLRPSPIGAKRNKKSSAHILASSGGNDDQDIDFSAMKESFIARKRHNMLDLIQSGMSPSRKLSTGVRF